MSHGQYSIYKSWRGGYINERYASERQKDDFDGARWASERYDETGRKRINVEDMFGRDRFSTEPVDGPNSRIDGGYTTSSYDGRIKLYNEGDVLESDRKRREVASLEKQLHAGKFSSDMTGATEKGGKAGLDPPSHRTITNFTPELDTAGASAQRDSHNYNGENSRSTKDSGGLPSSGGPSSSGAE